MECYFLYFRCFYVVRYLTPLTYGTWHTIRFCQLNPQLNLILWKNKHRLFWGCLKHHWSMHEHIHIHGCSCGILFFKWLLNLSKPLGITLRNICLLFQLLLRLNKSPENYVPKTTKIILYLVVPVGQAFEQGTVEIALISSMMSEVSGSKIWWLGCLNTWRLESSRAIFTGIFGSWHWL